MVRWGREGALVRNPFHQRLRTPNQIVRRDDSRVRMLIFFLFLRLSPPCLENVATISVLSAPPEPPRGLGCGIVMRDLEFITLRRT